jgi:RNA polymerase sigma-70 factor (ECF subfamily)
VYLDDLYRAALRLTGQAPDAEDLVQETCARAFKALNELKRLSTAKVWVFSILRSICLRQVERGPARGTLASSLDIEGSLLTPLTTRFVPHIPSRDAIRRRLFRAEGARC